MKPLTKGLKMGALSWSISGDGEYLLGVLKCLKINSCLGGKALSSLTAPDFDVVAPVR